jgi:hypothetical protein
VALSRARTLESLYLSDLELEVFHVDEKTRRFQIEQVDKQEYTASDDDEPDYNRLYDFDNLVEQWPLAQPTYYCARGSHVELHTAEDTYATYQLDFCFFAIVSPQYEDGGGDERGNVDLRDEFENLATLSVVFTGDKLTFSNGQSKVLVVTVSSSTSKKKIIISGMMPKHYPLISGNILQVKKIVQ